MYFIILCLDHRLYMDGLLEAWILPQNSAQANLSGHYYLEQGKNKIKISKKKKIGQYRAC